MRSKSKDYESLIAHKFACFLTYPHMVSNTVEQITCRVTGRVQLVMFRDFVTRRARALGLMGEVENMPDGSVRVVAQGPRVALTALVTRLRYGSLLSRVDDVSVVWEEPKQTFSKFVIRY